MVVVHEEVGGQRLGTVGVRDELVIILALLRKEGALGLGLGSGGPEGGTEAPLSADLQALLGERVSQAMLSGPPEVTPSNGLSGLAGSPWRGSGGWILGGHMRACPQISYAESEGLGGKLPLSL